MLIINFLSNFSIVSFITEKNKSIRNKVMVDFGDWLLHSHPEKKPFIQKVGGRGGSGDYQIKKKNICLTTFHFWKMIKITIGLIIIDL